MCYNCPDKKLGFLTESVVKGWVQEVIANRGKTSRNADCTPGYYNFEGEEQRRQDGNYNGSFAQYIAHVDDVFAKIEEKFAFTSRTEKQPSNA